ncbi:conserved hypothetical protein of the DUF143 family [Candidatus Kinetoplastibacterium desouzaii TCC079E]|uniref:Ribosomal silencing factor RsfS n=1 Tax=Candidatus Kinetoplastidibacterium desouzai TCC079E TaxID=1208919 RepID=M1LRJ7_9PROT|nr:ribosome silencing factor [Candidatus Kinetoplastibacterium desouzaii]AGF46756.1 conserved hypothetical protein of the DUF143 family [Candidatus Kinetoplastibacterium desouzaii TCC079E]
MNIINILENKIIKTLDDSKAQNIKTINTSGLTAIFDKIIISTATSTTHARSIAQKIFKIRKDFASIPSRNIEGISNAEWVIVDMNYIIVHIMQKDIRDFYDIENIWENNDVL